MNINIDDYTLNESLALVSCLNILGYKAYFKGVGNGKIMIRAEWDELKRGKKDDKKEEM